MEYTLEKLDVYLHAESFSDQIWFLVEKWDHFKKNTIGIQIVRSANSISANIAEGYGRHYYKESKQFYFYARGSIQETKSWLSKCKRRKIIEEKLSQQLIDKAEKILAMLNAYIKFIAKSQRNIKGKKNSNSGDTDEGLSK